MNSDPSSPVAGWRMPAKLRVRMIENQFIPTPEGARLAVQLWLPADDRPAPVVLEYIPYRKRDRYRAYGQYWGRTLAERGLAYARLDTRGSGDSAGVLTDEYLPGEQSDAAAAIAWLAAQPWCDGSVGMRGVSWGGFSALQAAALAPPALKAIMPMCASDMRYACDAHYIGGAFALTGLKWATSFKLVMAGPPDPLIAGEAWEALWRERLAATPAIAARWLSHQTNDAYWSQGSVGADWSAIRCPVYLVGGLVDPYADGLMRLLAHLEVPRKGLIGPWRHGYPLPASPGPALDWAFEEVRWWRHWLTGEETGIMAEPMLRVFMPEATAAEVAPGPIPGRWIAEHAWPSPRIAERALHLGRRGLHDAAQSAETMTLVSDTLVGLGKVEWVPFDAAELPAEQSADDARSLSFDTAPLAEDLQIMGQPRLRVRLAADRPVARVAVRLAEVAASGQSWLVSWGLLNLTHRTGHAAPEALRPGMFYDVEVPLAFTTHRFRKGRRIRAALSESLWPLVWPSPEAVTLTLEAGACRLELPVRPSGLDEPAMPIAERPAPAHDPARSPRLDVEQADGLARVVETWPLAVDTIVEIDETVTASGPNIVLRMDASDPESCVWRAEQSIRFQRPGWDVAVNAEVTIRASASHFQVVERTFASLNGEPAADITHRTDIPRVLM